MRLGKLLAILFCATVQFAWGSELELAGFYQGKDIYIRNPYVFTENRFCIESIMINEQEMITSPRVASIRIDLDGFAMNELVRILVIHSEKCIPDVINPQDLVWREDFRFSSLFALEDGISWTTENEYGPGNFTIEYNNQGIWEKVESVQARGASASYEYAIDHPEHENLYRVIYEPLDDEPVISKTIDYVRIKEPLSFAPVNVADEITFSRKVFFEIHDRDGNQIFSGEEKQVNVSGLRKGSYVLYLDGEKFTFNKL
jgi:hypothetical protein